MTNQTEWNGEGLPPVGAMVHISNSGSKYKVIGYSTIGSVVCESMTVHEYKGFHARDLKPLPPKPKKIDMAKFAGSDVWLVHINNGEKRNQAKEFDKCQGIMRDVYRPMLDVWNHWTGDSEPEWLEPFEYEVKFWHGSDCVFHTLSKDMITKGIQWSIVCAIKIISIKEGWE